MFYNFKISTPNGQPAYLKKITLVQRQSCSTQRSQVFKAPTSSLSNKFENRYHKNLLGLNKTKASEALVGSYKTPIRLLHTLPPKVKMDILRFTQKDLDQIIQLVFRAQIQKEKSSLFENKLKTKNSDVYCRRFHIEYYHFYYQYKDHFAIMGATR